MKNNKKDMKLDNIDAVKMELKALKYPSTRKEFERREFLLDKVRKYNNDMLDAALELEEFDMRNYNSPQLYNKEINLLWEDKESQNIDYYSGFRKHSKKVVSCLILCDLQKGMDDFDKLKEYEDMLLRKLNLDDFDIVIATKFKNVLNSPFRRLLRDYSMTSEDETGLISFAEYNSDVIFERGTRSIFNSELIEYINDNNIVDIYLCGYDLCTTILNSALDAFNAGYNLHILTDLCETSYPEPCKQSSLEVLNINVPVYLSKSELDE